MGQTQNNEAKFLHFRYVGLSGVEARGGLTIAYIDAGKGIVRYSSATCHINDNFVKALGRAKAAGRLRSAKLARTFIGDEHLFTETVTNIAREAGMIRKFNGKRKITR